MSVKEWSPEVEISNPWSGIEPNAKLAGPSPLQYGPGSLNDWLVQLSINNVSFKSGSWT